MQEFIYFIQVGESGPIKIGYTTDIRKRLATLQVGQSEQLEILAVIYGSKQDENSLHKQFKIDRIRGEWFTASIPLLTYVDRLISKLDVSQIIISKEFDKFCINCRIECNSLVKERCSKCYRFYKKRNIDRIISKK